MHVCVCMGVPVGGMEMPAALLRIAMLPHLHLPFLSPSFPRSLPPSLPPCPLQVLVAAVNPRLPMHIQCPRCGQAVTTIVRSQVNGCTFLGYVLFSFRFLSSSDSY